MCVCGGGRVGSAFALAEGYVCRCVLCSGNVHVWENSFL